MLVQGQARKASGEGWPDHADFRSMTLVPKCSCVLCWTPREKSSVEDEIKEKEEAIRQHSSEVQVSSRCCSESPSLTSSSRRAPFLGRLLVGCLLWFSELSHVGVLAYSQ